MSDLIDPMILFGQPGHGAGPCCSCCNGYCPRQDTPGPFAAYAESMIHAVIDGRDVVTDRYIGVHADALAAWPDDASVHWLTVPDKPATNADPSNFQPPPAAPLPDVQTHRMDPDRLDRIDRAGLTIRGLAEDGKISWLYHGDQWVGWVSAYRRDPEWGPILWDATDLPLIRRIAEHAQIDLDSAVTALHLARGGEIS